MSGGINQGDAALWRRWQLAAAGETAAGATPLAAEPEASILAAYAEYRLPGFEGDAEADATLRAVEAWLSSNPDTLGDVLAARGVMAETETVSAAAIDRAMRLVVDAEDGAISLSPRRGGWRRSVAWGGIAAGLVAASIVGFSVGLDDVLSLASAGKVQSMDQELLGPPGALLGGLNEDSAT
jgi:hypothetical protein